MTEKQAMEKGWSFTGHYSHDKDEMKAKLDGYKKVGYRGAVVNCPPSPLSRGSHGMGYSVYLERRYFLDERAIETQKYLDNIEARKQRALEKYQESLREIESQREEWEGNLKSINREREALRERA